MAAAVIEAARRLGIDYQQLTGGAEALASADAILLTSSLVGVRPARLGAGGPVSSHPMVAALAEAGRHQLTRRHPPMKGGLSYAATFCFSVSSNSLTISVQCRSAAARS